MRHNKWIKGMFLGTFLSMTTWTYAEGTKVILDNVQIQSGIYMQRNHTTIENNQVINKVYMTTDKIGEIKGNIEELYVAPSARVTVTGGVVEKVHYIETPQSQNKATIHLQGGASIKNIIAEEKLIVEEEKVSTDKEDDTSSIPESINPPQFDIGIKVDGEEVETFYVPRWSEDIPISIQLKRLSPSSNQQVNVYIEVVDYKGVVSIKNEHGWEQVEGKILIDTISCSKADTKIDVLSRFSGGGTGKMNIYVEYIEKGE